VELCVKLPHHPLHLAVEVHHPPFLALAWSFV
jgi:hypothetical protein